MLKIRSLFLVWLFFIAKIVVAQDGTLDVTFGNAGKVLPTFGGYLSDINAIVVQPDGKIITAGGVFNQSGYNKFVLVRYNIDGSLDATFGTEGKVINDSGGRYLDEIVLQLDGKIIIGLHGSGAYASSSTSSTLARYNSNGELDSSFGNNGTIIKNANIINSFALQPDGKIIAAESSYSTENSVWNSSLILYNSNGTVSADFGTNGSVTTTYGREIILQNDGKIILAGSTGNDNMSDFVFVRYLNNGTLDTSFGSSGMITLDIDAHDSFASGKMQTDGKIVFVGQSSHMIAPYEYAVTYELIRLFPNGDLDTDFGREGITELEIRSGSVEIQPDGKIITSGGTVPIPDGPNEIALSRFLTNGDPDSTFGDNGVVTTSLGNSIRGGATSVKLAPDGEIVVGGSYCEAYNSCHPGSFVMRYNSGLLSNTLFDTPKNSFVLYPNPVNETINLDFNLNESQILSMDMYDSNGRKIISLLQDEVFPMGYNSHKLDLPETLSKGIYFLNISNSRNTTSIKIVK